MPLLADAQDALRLMRHSVWSWVALAVLLVLLAAFVFWVRSWFRDDSGPAADDGEMLMLVRELRREGVLSDEEFRSLKGRLHDHDERGTNAPPPAGSPTHVETASPGAVSPRTPSEGESPGETT